MFDFSFGDISVTRIVEMEMPMLGGRNFSPTGIRRPSNATKTGWCRGISIR